MRRRIGIFALTACLAFLPVTQVMAETTGEITAVTTPETTAETSDTTDDVTIEETDKPYLALGADLTEEQKSTVLGLMGIDAAQLDNYDVLTVSNEEEHNYLDSYIDSSKIGTRALSSIVIVEGESGDGIHISTYNISYCTVGMYKNALVTAGVEDADIIVAGPFSISGTAALVGIIKAYEEMTGDEMSEDNVDAALNEIVVTGSIEADDADAETVEGFIAYIKKEVAEQGISSTEDIQTLIADAEEEFGITLSEDELEQVTSLMQKISTLDLDTDKLKEQAEALYDKVAELDADGTISGWFDKIVTAVKNFLSNLF